MGDDVADLRARLGALADAATAGPWAEKDRTVSGDRILSGNGWLISSVYSGLAGVGEHNAALIVALVNAWPAIDGMLARLAAAEADAAVIDAAHLAHQREWSKATFGPGDRLLGVLDHIRKELAEIEADPTDLGEWVDVVILAFDGAWRAGWEPQEIIDAIKAKQAKNEAREWPDWRAAPTDRAIEHLRDPR